MITITHTQDGRLAWHLSDVLELLLNNIRLKFHDPNCKLQIHDREYSMFYPFEISLQYNSAVVLSIHKTVNMEHFYLAKNRMEVPNV